MDGTDFKAKKIWKLMITVGSIFTVANNKINGYKRNGHIPFLLLYLQRTSVDAIGN